MRRPPEPSIAPKAETFISPARPRGRDQPPRRYAGPPDRRNQDPSTPLTCFLNMGESSSLLKNMAASASPPPPPRPLIRAPRRHYLHIHPRATAVSERLRSPRPRSAATGTTTAATSSTEKNRHSYLRPKRRETLGARPTAVTLWRRWHRNPRRRPEPAKWRRFAWGGAEREESNGSTRGEGTRTGRGETGRGKEKSVRWKITVRFISDLSLIVI